MNSAPPHFSKFSKARNFRHLGCECQHPEFHNTHLEWPFHTRMNLKTPYKCPRHNLVNSSHLSKIKCSEFTSRFWEFRMRISSKLLTHLSKEPLVIPFYASNSFEALPKVNSLRFCEN